MVDKAASLNQEEVLSRACGSFLAAQSCDLRAVIDRKIEDLGHYNVAAMNRVVAICYWGRSGSILLASYLDGHDNVVMLPSIRGHFIYGFFERYTTLSLWDKLIAYPFFVSEYEPFFQGNFAIQAVDYYAAVKAIFEVFGNWSPEFLESRRAFFQFVHVAYSLALGRHPAIPEPIMVYAQHEWDGVMAGRLVEDFPEARFIHTVRDPIAAFDRRFDDGFRRRPDSPSLPLYVACSLVERDGPHPGMESRTRAIRFEDLHCDTAETLRRLVGWLGLPFQASLLESTFNGTPYVVERNGKVWSGQRPEQAQRSSENISFVDRALIFALLYDNFATWNYPCPKIFSRPFVRGITCMLLLLIPMKMEVITACAVIKLQVLPSLRSGNVRRAMNRVLQIVYYRLALMSVVATECFRRLRTKKILLQPI